MVPNEEFFRSLRTSLILLKAKIRAAELPFTISLKTEVLSTRAIDDIIELIEASYGASITEDQMMELRKKFEGGR